MRKYIHVYHFKNKVDVLVYKETKFKLLIIQEETNKFERETVFMKKLKHLVCKLQSEANFSSCQLSNTMFSFVSLYVSLI